MRLMLHPNPCQATLLGTLFLCGAVAGAGEGSAVAGKPARPAAGESVGERTEWVSEGRWPLGKNRVESTPAKQFKKAKRLEELGDVRQAAEEYRRLADVYSESDEAEEALILAAKNFLAAGNYTRCREEITEVRRRYVHPTFLDALGQVEADLGRGFLEGRGEGGTYKLASRVRKAQSIYQHILDEDAQGRWADDALLGLGQCDETLGNYDEAIKRYKHLLEKYPGSELRAEAEGRIATCIQKREPRPEYSETDTKEALARIEMAKGEAKAGELGLDLVALEENEKLLRERQAQKRFEQAVFYAKNGHFRAAEVYYELVKTHFPESPWAKKADVALTQLRSR